MEKRAATASRPNVVYWENHRLIRATHWREAFRKAVAMRSSDEAVGKEAFDESPCFLGVTDLVPILEPFEDGAEILWAEFDAEDEPLVYTENDLAAVYDSEDESEFENDC